MVGERSLVTLHSKVVGFMYMCVRVCVGGGGGGKGMFTRKKTNENKVYINIAKPHITETTQLIQLSITNHHTGLQGDLYTDLYTENYPDQAAITVYNVRKGGGGGGGGKVVV